MCLEKRLFYIFVSFEALYYLDVTNVLSCFTPLIAFQSNVLDITFLNLPKERRVQHDLSTLPESC